MLLLISIPMQVTTQRGTSAITPISTTTRDKDSNTTGLNM